ncbi:hypothetical protein EG329_001450 [Mollisiaceae sp. DMI_Dod_QoI]|nr:hypothetical protein EG329_001450 [Helotiales sp. DMI_Dod_QoI]
MASKQASSESASTVRSQESTLTLTPMPKCQSLVDTRGEGELKPSQSLRATADELDGGEEDIEGTIVTDGARSISSRLIEHRKETMDNTDISEYETDSEEHVKAAKPKQHIGFPPPEELPPWFPKYIKAIYRELNAITRYRVVVGIVHRRRWKEYVKAGEARWKLQQVLRRLRSRPLTKAFYEYRRKQFILWKEKALRTWKKLEKIQRGILILDETININFRQERMIYAKKLRGLKS